MPDTDSRMSGLEGLVKNQEIKKQEEEEEEEEEEGGGGRGGGGGGGGGATLAEEALLSRHSIPEIVRKGSP